MVRGSCACSIAPLLRRAQSGVSDPRSPFYDNLLEGWAKDGSFPLLYSREKILEHRAFTVTLTPR
jgi:penicillin amidase